LIALAPKYTPCPIGSCSESLMVNPFMLIRDMKRMALEGSGWIKSRARRAPEASPIARRNSRHCVNIAK
jgi:hypothetical protein